MRATLHLFGAAMVALLTLAPLSASVAHADTSNFTFESFDAEYTLSQTAAGHATVHVVETIVAVFPNFDQNRGIIRALPNDYDGVPLNTTVLSVKDENGAPVPFEADSSGRFTELALGTDDFVHGRTTYVISYTQQNVVRAFSDTANDEFYWDINGTGWDQPFGRVSATVRVDSELAASLTGSSACYFGVEGSGSQCEITQTPDADGVQFFASATNLGPRETLTVAIGFEADTFVQVPPQVSDPGDFPSSGRTEPAWWAPIPPIVVLLASIGVATAAIVRRVRAPRHAKGRGIIIPQYSVPKGINLLEAGELVGRTSSSVAAQLVSFAVRGNLRILDYAVTPSGADYSLQLLNAEGADKLELDLLRAFFGGHLEPGAVVEIGVVDDALATRIAAVKKRAHEAVVARGFLQKPPSGSGGALASVTFAIIFFAVPIAIVSSSFGGSTPLWTTAMIAAFVCFFVAVATAARPTVVTEAGAEHRDYLLGMRDYLRLAEADRLRMLQSPTGADRIDIGDEAEVVRLYEKLLPFAVLWGVEGEWSKVLAVHYELSVQQPDWFISSSAFNTANLVRALDGLSRSVATTSTPTPAPSTWSGSGGGSFSGGSFGGGFSGGGGGGGGGGGR